jgi:long-chain fatty acid transport protein
MCAFRKFASPVIVCTLSVLPAAALASGFALQEQNASGLGNAFAGAGAVAGDASTIFFNPAGMSHLPGTQFAIAGDLVVPSAKFNNTGSIAAPLQPLGGTGGDAEGPALVPSGYLSYQVNPRLWLGVGLNAPFGLVTEYDSDWMGRFQAIKSSLTTYNLNPSIAFKLNDTVTIGAGIDYQYAKAELTNAVDYSALAFGTPLFPLVGAGQSGTVKLDGNDTAWGFNLGAMFNLSPATRIGLAYRSAIRYTISGNVSFSDVPAAFGLSPTASAGVANGPVSADLKLPPSASLSLFHKLHPRGDIMADLSWTGWSSFHELKVVRDNGVVLSDTKENWSDTWRIGAGANYHYNSRWTWRFGVAYDQSPTDDQYRTARVPDADRYWVALGAQYRLTPRDVIDVGYAHIFVRDASIDHGAPGAGRLVGSYDSRPDNIGIQYSRRF